MKTHSSCVFPRGLYFSTVMFGMLWPFCLRGRYFPKKQDENALCCSPALVWPDGEGVGADIRWVGHLSATLPKLALHLEPNSGGLGNGREEEPP